MAPFKEKQIEPFLKHPGRKKGSRRRDCADKGIINRGLFFKAEATREEHSL